MKAIIYRIWVLIFIIPLVIVCQKLDVTNPFDPDCPPELWTPKSFNAELIGTYLDFEWEQPNTNISGFIIERKIGSGEFEKVTTLTKEVLTWQDMNLVNGQLHTYQLYAYAGDNTSNVVSVNKTPVIKIDLSTLVASEITYKSAKLNGEINPNGYDTEVTFKYKKVTETEWNEITLPDPYSGTTKQAVSVTVTNLDADTDYEYKVTSTNDLGTEESDIIEFKTNPVSLEFACNEFNVSYKSGTVVCTIETNVEDWEASASDWLSATRNGDKLNISHTANSLAEERTQDVKVLAYGVEKTIKFTQQGDEIVNIPDSNFKDYLINNTEININGDDEIRLSEAEGHTGSLDIPDQNISDLTGIETFIGITHLRCITSTPVTTLNLSKNINLESVELARCDLESELSANIELEYISLSDCYMENLDVSQNKKLSTLRVSNNQFLKSINASQNIALVTLNATDNPELTQLNVSNAINLESMGLEVNALTSLDISNNNALSHITVRYNKLTEIKLGENNNLIFLDLDHNDLTNIDVSLNRGLEVLQLRNNKLTELDVSQINNLTAILVNDNDLINLDLRNNTNSIIERFDATNNPNLKCINVSDVNYANTNWTNFVDAGVEFSINCDQTTTVTDYEGNVYQTVQIGNQRWMAENLKSTKYADGTAIPIVTDNTAWGNLDDNDEDKAYCFYNNNINNSYGALYTFAAAVNGTPHDGSNHVQGVCPNGWHVPSDEEWKTLETYLGMSQTEADDDGWRGTNEGGKLKETGTNNWVSPNTGATDEVGFTALPGGHRRFDSGEFGNIGIYGNWWSSSESNNSNAWYRVLYSENANIYRTNYNKSYGFCVRCIKDY